MRSALPSLASERERLRSLGLPAFETRLREAGWPSLEAQGIEVLQLNLGPLCNQTCAHCHVDAGPLRREAMSAATIDCALRVLEQSSIPCVDITGGAPELHPEFERLVRGARALGRRVMDRCNLTVLSLPKKRGLARFLAENQVEVVASLPHYRAPLTDRQRGDGVFADSIAGLRLLMAEGYAQAGSSLELSLVTNPVGAFLPSSSQAALEAEWRRELRRLHGIEFTRLYTLTNMPIRRFLAWLESSSNLESYMEKLVSAFNPAAIAPLMCRTTLSVGWDGRLYDCDFNQMLELGLLAPAPTQLAAFDWAALSQRRIATGAHCYGCTAGAGSSCGGALTEELPAAGR